MNTETKSEIKKCEHCGKSLKAFTKSTDWKTRRYHKKCYKEFEAKKQWEDFLKRL